MNTFAYGIFLQWKLDIRNKGMILTYYLVPLVFFGFMGGIFASINPLAKDTLIQTMTVFAVSMGAFLGAPIPLVELLRSDIKKAYKVGGIPLGVAMLNNLISGFIHLFIVSLIIFFLAPILFKATIPDNLLLYFTSLAMFIFTCLLLGSILGLFVKSTSKLAMVSQVLFLPSIMLSGIMFPSNMLPKAFEYLGKALPATWGYINMSIDSFSKLTLTPFVLITIGAIGIITIKIRNLEGIN
ncbi:MAG: ABC transporter permease [Candidatus Methanofastidiosa archaeon]|nr:ABC transporter permease [Candidatus Methanofastidiosa archaeon]